MNVELILSRLEKVRQVGPSKWMALCPAHQDKDRSLSIRESGDRILVHAFCGCDTADVLAAVGLEWSDLMPPTSLEDKRRYAQQANAGAIKKALDHEALIIMISRAFTGPFTFADGQRIAQAKARLVRAGVEVAS